MAIRTINYYINSPDVVSDSRQYAGQQGEDNATKITYNVAAELIKIMRSDYGDLKFRIDFNSIGAGYNPGEIIDDLNENLDELDYLSFSRDIPGLITQFGGEMKTVLVITALNQNSEAQMEILSVQNTVFFTPVVKSTYSYEKVYKNLTAIEQQTALEAKKATQAMNETKLELEKAKSVIAEANETIQALSDGEAAFIDKIRVLSVQKDYKNRFDGTAVKGYVNYVGFAESTNMYRTSHIYLTAGSYIYKPNTTPFGVNNTGFIANTDADGNLIAVIKATDIDTTKHIFKIDITEDGYYAFNIGWSSTCNTFMIIAGETAEDFPITYIPYGATIEEDVGFSSSMIKELSKKIENETNEIINATAFVKRKLITAKYNLNDIREAGEYYWASNDAPQNAPFGIAGALSVIEAPNTISSSTPYKYCTQIAKSGSGGVFLRTSSTVTGAFGDWLRCDNPTKFLSYNDRKTLLNRKKTTEPFTTTAPTFPVLNKMDLTIREYYPTGTKKGGIVYSSCWREGLDALWNVTPETYYSAVKNPASVLYTENLWGRVYNEAAYYGSVCSTTALKICGYKYPYLTREFPLVFKEKRNHDINNIEVGDLLWVAGHTAGVTGVNVDCDGNVISVEITEQDSISHTFTKTADEWDSYFADTWTAIYYGEHTCELLKTYPVNDSIIFARGNNTYVTDYSTMLFYIPEATTIYLTVNGNTTQYSKTDFSTVTVNNVSVYNLTSLFTGVGDYYLHTDLDDTDICIKVINLGNISISNNHITLGGFENCTPICYRIIDILDGESADYNFWNVPEGYHGDPRDNTFTDITVDSFDITNAPTSSYKLLVYYDTGYGWAQQLSNDLIINA